LYYHPFLSSRAVTILGARKVGQDCILPADLQSAPFGSTLTSKRGRIASQSAAGYQPAPQGRKRKRESSQIKRGRLQIGLQDAILPYSICPSSPQ
jgi:hypothetical protein